MTTTTSSSHRLESMEEISKVFNCFDKDGDGKISSSEIGDVLRALGSHTTDEELHQMMEEIDKNGDGYIDLNEFAEFHKTGFCHGDGDPDSGVSELKDAFDLYDKDSNGLISASELHMVLKSLGEKCSIEDCARMISSVDSDGDGFVNFEEFKKMMSNSLQ